ncbi:MAG: hypothetical protein ACR2JR_16505 [Rubrobacteraceae bacterium]
MLRIQASGILLGVALMLGVAAAMVAVQQAADAQTAELKRYNVLLRGTVGQDGFDAAARA